MRITGYSEDASLALGTGVPSGGGGGGSLGSVTDGTTTVSPATGIDFTSGAAVTDLGGGVAGVAVTGGSGFELNTEGGQSVIRAHGSMGSAETFDPTDGNVHTGTLNAACAITLGAPVGSGACTIEGWLTEDGTGGWGVTFAGWSVTEQGTHDTTAGTLSRFVAESVDGGTTGIVTWVGSGSSTPAAAHYLVIASSHSTPLVFADLVQASAGDDLVYTT